MATEHQRGIKKYPKIDWTVGVKNIKVNFDELPNKKTYTTEDAYMLHKKSVPLNSRITKKNYAIIIKELVILIYELLMEGYTIKMPFKLGGLRIKSKLTSFEPNANGNVVAPVDWQRTKKLWAEHPEEKEKKTRIFYTNEHSEYKSYRVSWRKPRGAVKNSSFYHFSLSDYIFKARFAELIRKGLKL
tara:strand:+ start:4179 stop:4739 length:561 start_codon:yes stop_codon:yes gene_type:complete